jgi:hypothetical protein
MLDRKLIAQLETAQSQTTDEFYKKIAARHCAEQGSFVIEGCVAVVAGMTGFSLVGTVLGAVAGAALPISWIGYKLWNGYEGLQDVESGDWVRRLPEREKQRYLTDKAEELKALPAAKGTTKTEALDDSQSTPVDPRKVAPPIAQDWTDKQWQLWNRLMLDCPDLRFALFSKVLVISGPQQTGKSSLASAIAYLRAVLLNQPTIAVTPHIDGDRIFAGQVVGSGGNFAAIEEWYTELVESFEMDGQRRSLIIDELTQYAGEHEKLGQSLVKTSLSESDKHGYGPILINHARTVSAGFGNIKGMKELIDSSATQITRQYKTADWGEQQRSPVVTLSRPGKKDIEITVPKWFYMPTIAKHFPLPQPEPTEQDDPFATPSNVVNLQRQPTEPTNTELVIPDNLPKMLRPIVDYSAKQGWVKAHQVRSNVRSCRDFDAEQIRSLFQMAVNYGVGSVMHDGEQMEYNATIQRHDRMTHDTA